VNLNLEWIGSDSSRGLKNLGFSRNGNNKPSTSPEDFEVMEVHKSEDVLGLNVIAILELDGKEDVKFQSDVYHRMIARTRTSAIFTRGRWGEFKPTKTEPSD